MQIKIGVILAVVMASLSIATHATAQVRVIAAMPAQSGVVQPGARVWLRFNAPIDKRTVRITLRRGGSGHIALRLTFSDDRRLIYLHPARPLARGTYQVVWHTRGPDGIPVRGAYDFIVL